MESPIEMDDLELPLFLETPICYKTCILLCTPPDNEPLEPENHLIV